MRVLVCYGSRRGGTKGLAESVGEGLSEEGHQVDVRPASEIDGLEAWDAVVVGGALYVWRWHGDARKFVVHHAKQLAELPVWFFSSGPLDDSAEKREIPPVGRVGRLMNKVEAKAHKTFGGRLQEAAGGGGTAPAGAKEGEEGEMPHGDWRNLEDARAWGRGIGEEMAKLGSRREALPELETRGQRRARRVAETLAMFTGVTGLFGGGALVVSPSGSGALGLPLELLSQTPFSSFLIPGLLLFFFVGVTNLWASIHMLTRASGADSFVFAGGLTLTVWIGVQMWMLQTVAFLQVVYLVVGVGIMIAAGVAQKVGRTESEERRSRPVVGADEPMSG